MPQHPVRHHTPAHQQCRTPVAIASSLALLSKSPLHANPLVAPWSVTFSRGPCLCSCHRVGRFGAQPWRLASSLADTPFSCSRQIETDEQPAAMSSTTTTTEPAREHSSRRWWCRAAPPLATRRLSQSSDHRSGAAWGGCEWSRAAGVAAYRGAEAGQAWPSPSSRGGA